MLEKLCCMRLRTAGIVLGWLGVIGSVIWIIQCAGALGNIDKLNKYHAEHGEPQSSKGVVIGFLFLYILNLIASGLLIMGTMKDRHSLLLPWLIISAISIVIGTINGIFQMVALSSNIPVMLLSLLITVLIIALAVYFFYGIYSLYKEIQQKNTTHRPMARQI